jgi:hypothetical protein
MKVAKRYVGRGTAREVAGFMAKVLGTLALASTVTCAAPASSATGPSLTLATEASVAAVEAPDPEGRGQECDAKRAAGCNESWLGDYENAQAARR